MKLTVKTEIDENQMRKMFSLITETCVGAKYNSGKGKRLFNEMFRDINERETAERWIKKCKKWTLNTGVPKNLELSPADLGTLKKLEAYCMNL